jgi:hypothetical protein
MQNLTRLELPRCCFEPGVLSDKTLQQHLNLSSNEGVGGVISQGDVQQLLSHLQALQQLTYLSARGTLVAFDVDGDPPAAPYSAVTANSKLQHLDISDCTLPAGVWQHLFPTGRQLPHLTSLNISAVKQPDRSAAAPVGTRLASCCPGLQTLDLGWLKYIVELLAPLQELSGLHTLTLATLSQFGPLAPEAMQGLLAVSQLTRLEGLKLASHNHRHGRSRAAATDDATEAAHKVGLPGTTEPSAPHRPHASRSGGAVGCFMHLRNLAS